MPPWKVVWRVHFNSQIIVFEGVTGKKKGVIEVQCVIMNPANLRVKLCY